MLKKGLVQVYTGDGKGKTTAALGQALRAAGRGNRVLFFQFLKPPALETGERMAIKKAALPIEIRGLDVKWDMFKSFRDLGRDYLQLFGCPIFDTSIEWLGLLRKPCPEIFQRNAYLLLFLE